jgi:hypothetical protein
VGVLACKCVLAHLLLRVEGHCHDVAHNTLMALPPYTRTREGETPQLGAVLTPCRQSFCVRNCPLPVYSILNFSTLKRVVKEQCSWRPLRERRHIKTEKIKCKCI